MRHVLSVLFTYLNRATTPTENTEKDRTPSTHTYLMPAQRPCHFGHNNLSLLYLLSIEQKEQKGNKMKHILQQLLFSDDGNKNSFKLVLEKFSRKGYLDRPTGGKEIAASLIV